MTTTPPRRATRRPRRQLPRRQRCEPLRAPRRHRRHRAAVVTDFVDNQVVPDDRIDAVVANTDLERLKQHRSRSSPPTHHGRARGRTTGRTMADSHAGLGITGRRLERPRRDLSNSRATPFERRRSADAGRALGLGARPARRTPSGSSTASSAHRPRPAPRPGAGPTPRVELARRRGRAATRPHAGRTVPRRRCTAVPPTATDGDGVGQALDPHEQRRRPLDLAPCDSVSCTPGSTRPWRSRCTPTGPAADPVAGSSAMPTPGRTSASSPCRRR